MNIGYIGEHKATKLIIALSPDLKDATSYKIEFSTCGKVIASNTVTASNGVINYAIPQDITLMPIIESVMGIQVIGNSGENIIKSPIVEAYIGSSLLDSTEVASDTPTDISTKVEQLMAAKHSHDNKAILDKFAEANGKPTYNGIAIGSGGTGGASTAEEVSYTNTALPDVANVKTALDKIAGVQQTHEDDIVTVGEILNALDRKAHTHDNKDVLDKLSVLNGKLQYDGSDVGLKGDKGGPGAPGKDGVTPTIGENGNWYLGETDTGKPSRGAAGHSPVVTATKSGSVTTIKVDGKVIATINDGKNGTNGKTPIKGTDYWTASDKQEMVEAVLAALPDGTEVTY